MTQTRVAPFDLPPNSVSARARARLEAAGACDEIRAKAARELALTRQAHAEELAREQARAGASVRKTWIASLSVAAAAALSLFAAPLFSAPSLSSDADALVSAPRYEAARVTVRSDARAVREVDARGSGRATQNETRTNETTTVTPGECNEWDPLAFCLRR